MVAIKPVGTWKVRGVCFAVVVAFGVCAMAQDGAGGSAGGGSDPNGSGPHGDCLTNSGSCFVSHDGPGCSDPFCCAEVCSQHGPEGAFCCAEMWDQVCVHLAETYCKEPVGACCDWVNLNENGEAVCRDVPLSECPERPGGDLPQWIERAACASEPFDPPCGVAACCHYRTDPDTQQFEQACLNLTRNECESQLQEPRPPVWQPGEFCGLNDQACPLNHCINEILPCDPGPCPLFPCSPDIFCCETICSSGPLGEFCCYTSWDSACCELVETLCRDSNCPAGDIAFIDPPNQVVDARRPYPPNSPQPAEGMRTIVAKGPAGATKDCWSFCQTPDIPAFVQISSVEEEPPGTYRIELNEAIAPGAMAFLTYTDNEEHKTVGRFVAHPGNVNGSSYTNAYDILALIDFLNGVGSLPWGKYSGDLDHSGIIGPADIITLIDLLNGNGFAAWYGTTLPDAEGCP